MTHAFRKRARKFPCLKNRSNIFLAFPFIVQHSALNQRDIARAATT